MQEWAVLNKLNDKTVQRVFGRVILGIKTCEVFLCFLAIIFLGFIVLTSYWLLCINCFTSLFNNDNDFQDITSIRWFSVYLISGRTGISKCLLLRSEKKKTGVPGEKPLGAKERTSTSRHPWSLTRVPPMSTYNQHDEMLWSSYDIGKSKGKDGTHSIIVGQTEACRAEKNGFRRWSPSNLRVWIKPRTRS